MNKSGPIWTHLSSGIVVPTGKISDLSVRSKTNYLEIKDRATQLENLYDAVNISIPPTSGLGELIKNAKELSDNYLLGNSDKLTYQMMFLSMHLDRITDALLLLAYEPENCRYLKELLSGSINFFDRELSHAKDIFWELEVWSKIRKRLGSTYLQEPPDIVVDYDDSLIGISCKKLYSEKHVQNVLSQAVKQIEKGFQFGIVAINLDDLLPSDVVLKLESSDAVNRRLNQINEEFIKRHARHFKKYFARSRIISVLVSTSIITDIVSEKPRFWNANQWTIWTVTELEECHKRQLSKFYQTIMG